MLKGQKPQKILLSAVWEIFLDFQCMKMQNKSFLEHKTFS